MFRKIAALTIALLILHNLNAKINEPEQVKIFDDFQCKLTLPGLDYEWYDNSKIPLTKAALKGKDGILLFLVMKAPKQFAIDETFTEGFDRSFSKPGVVTKEKGEVITFKGVPCYQIHARSEKDNSITTVRAFGANGNLYQLQLVGSPLPIAERGKLDSYFNAFDFIGTPIAPKPSVKPANFSENMGRIAGLCIIVIIILIAMKKLNKAKNSGTTEDSEATN